MALVVVVVAGLKAAAPLILPVLAAALLAMALLPLTRKLQAWKVPRAVAVVLVMLVVTVAFVGVGGVVAGTVRSFVASLGVYQVRLWETIDSLGDWLQAHEFDPPPEAFGADAAASFIIDVAREAAEHLLSLASNIFLVLLVMLFILLESHTFPERLRSAYGDRLGLSGINDQVYRYLHIKAGMSLLTGLLVGLGNLALGVDFPFLWALMAFLFNFIPNVGSVIAALPPIALALLEFGVGRAVVVTIVYLVVNMGVSNVLEPRVMGERLGLSPLVVILSLLFWAWVWGPFGMILALPMTMVVKILFESSRELRPIALLLGPAVKAAEAPPPPEAAQL